jgi:hypothetical protein
MGHKYYVGIMLYFDGIFLNLTPYTHLTCNRAYSSQGGVPAAAAAAAELSSFSASRSGQLSRS